MSIARYAVLLGLTAIVFGGCSNYKQVDDPSDGDNGKFKNRPASTVR